MVVVDTSVWVEVFRDSTGSRARGLAAALAGEEVALTRFHQLEMLQGARDEREWELLQSHLDGQLYLELGETSWEAAARIFFDLRRRGKTVRSPIDCCIAQVVMDHDASLLHRDRDFQQIATIRPLRETWLTWS